MSVHSATPREVYHTGAQAARSGRGRERRDIGGVAAVGAIALLGISCFALAERAAIVRLAPPLEAAYAALGMPAIPPGPELRRVFSRLVEEPGGPVLVVEGEIANSGRSAVAVAGLRVSVEGPDGREIYHWTAAPPKQRLAAGETISFRAKLVAPPSDARRVALRFARPDDDPWLAPR